MISGWQPQGELERVNFSGYSGAMMWKNWLLVILAGMFLASCSTSGRKYDTTAADRIVVGKTTDQEVLAMLGEPLSERKLSNGIKIYHYAYGTKCVSRFETAIDCLEIQIYKGRCDQETARCGRGRAPGSLARTETRGCFFLPALILSHHRLPGFFCNLRTFARAL